MAPKSQYLMQKITGKFRMVKTNLNFCAEIPETAYKSCNPAPAFGILIQAKHTDALSGHMHKSQTWLAPLSCGICQNLPSDFTAKQIMQIFGILYF
jgi:hypothetical protein